MKTKIASWSLFLIWLGVIFYFSSQTGVESTATSSGVLSTIETIIRIPITSEASMFFLRKLAHFTEYTILGILTMNLYFAYNHRENKYLFLAICFCFLYAISDEIHQGFVGGRSPQIFDVIIDTCGSVFGAICYKLVKLNDKRGV